MTEQELQEIRRLHDSSYRYATSEERYANHAEKAIGKLLDEVERLRHILEPLSRYADHQLGTVEMDLHMTGYPSQGELMERYAKYRKGASHADD